jgi:DNA mismatch repair protein MutL
MEVSVTIRVLPEKVASAIAAGEVVERPASVVKELIENALDAGATSINVITENGGRKLIEVSDDGIGIPAAEVPLAVARYATSKLETADDLFAIRTLGFRGEALSSIAAVSRFEIITRSADEETGARLLVEGGNTGAVEGMGAAQGTMVRVRDIFFNIPARQKFLKTDRTERSRIAELVTRYALAYPQVRFRLTQEGRESFHSSGNGDRREVLSSVYGVEIARQMIALPDDQEGPVRVRGFVSPPSVHRANRAGLTFFVNGRWVRDASLSTAVVQAYQTLLMVGRYPLVVLLLELAPEMVDVNVHPTKSEVRFREPKLVFSVLQRAVRATLLGQGPPQVELEPRWGDDRWQAQHHLPDPEWGIAHAVLGDSAGAESSVAQIALPRQDLPLLRAVGQVGSAYLVAEGPDGLYLIDQHAAHERVLFEALMAASQSDSMESQALLEPMTVELSPAQTALLEDQLQALIGLGFQVEPFGRQAFRLRAIPAMLSGLNPEHALRVAVEDFEEDESPLEGEMVARLAARVCKRAAIKSGQVLSMIEQQKLLTDLEACQAPRTCPHGRPTMIHLSVDALEKQFGRRG